MPRRDWPGRVEDILQAIATIRRYVQGMSFEEFCADERTIDAVLRNITAGSPPAGLPAPIPPAWPDQTVCRTPGSAARSGQ